MAIADRRIMIIAGGTGGHVFPGLAVARYLLQQGAQVSWMGTAAGIEARVVPGAGIELDVINISALRGKGMRRWLLLPIKFVRAMFQAGVILRRRRPQAVLAMGGFAAGPGSLVAWMMRIPLLVHEQNAVPGLTNRILAWFARYLLCGFPDAFASHPGARFAGNPVRREIAALPLPAVRYESRSGRLRLLVVGGSQGAEVFNQVVPQSLQALESPQRPEVWHQSGANRGDATRQRYQQAGVSARVSDFIEDMAEAYAWADLVMCRAGAMTVAELAAAGVAAVLVPLPHAADDHQTANARYLADRDAAFLLPQSELSPERLAGLVREMEGKRSALTTMATMARSLAVTDAADTVATLCLEAANA